ncbi:MAG: sigma 54-interacting transcriptional regulator [Planctomycetota bacterium]|jgi:Nif-specific regulatory protein|nr:sigma 54-interacting transcriptional regulator [Planctomycetota bacterium]MDP7130913.1 sigma 54-interacting transcriptional regulator [Planctomycetota bacterium]MDP7248605.1 sigma 54-interacting transcriptional regulator [Planctomycetota bacterium]
MPFLTIIDGPGVGNSFDLDIGEQVVGRELTADIPLNSLMVSRRHARVYQKDDQFFLQDLGSQNGTFVNGLPADLHSLAANDEIVIGEVVLNFSDSLMSGTGVHSALQTSSDSAVLSLTETIQSPPEHISKIVEPEQRWRRLPKDIRSLAVLNEISQMVAKTQTMEQFLNRLLELVINSTEADRGAALLLNARSNQLSVRASRNRAGQAEIQYSRSIIRYVLKRGIGILSPSPYEDDRFNASDSVTDLGLRSIICVPMRVRNRTIGIITLDSAEGEDFQQQHLYLLNTVAAQAALFIDNLRLQENQKRANLGVRRSLQSENLVIGKSRRMREIIDVVKIVAPTDSTVLIRGESGSGKEVIARTIHRQSDRRDKPMVAVNCGALSPTVLESELFGHEKGAFTGAIQQRLGRFELADGGTLFLDEISEMPLELQVRLLRVLQEQEFERVGGQKTIKVDVRIITATNRDLIKAIRNGSFREDLYFRLKVIELEMPPLRERIDDVPLLAQHFLQSYAGEMGRPTPTLSEEALVAMTRYPWPGNIRELKNAIERAVVLTRDDVIQPHELPLTSHMGDDPEDSDDDYTLAGSEERQIRKVLRVTEWNKTQASKLLGISRARLDRKIKDYDITKASMMKDT